MASEATGYPTPFEGQRTASLVLGVAGGDEPPAAVAACIDMLYRFALVVLVAVLGLGLAAQGQVRLEADWDPDNGPPDGPGMTLTLSPELAARAEAVARAAGKEGGWDSERGPGVNLLEHARGSWSKYPALQPLWLKVSEALREEGITIESDEPLVPVADPPKLTTEVAVESAALGGMVDGFEELGLTEAAKGRLRWRLYVLGMREHPAPVGRLVATCLAMTAPPEEVELTPADVAEIAEVDFPAALEAVIAEEGGEGGAPGELGDMMTHPFVTFGLPGYVHYPLLASETVDGTRLLAEAEERGADLRGLLDSLRRAMVERKGGAEGGEGAAKIARLRDHLEGMPADAAERERFAWVLEASQRIERAVRGAVDAMAAGEEGGRESLEPLLTPGLAAKVKGQEGPLLPVFFGLGGVEEEPVVRAWLPVPGPEVGVWRAFSDLYGHVNEHGTLPERVTVRVDPTVERRSGKLEHPDAQWVLVREGEGGKGWRIESFGGEVER